MCRQTSSASNAAPRSAADPSGSAAPTDASSSAIAGASVIEGAGSSRGRGVIAKTLETQSVYACLDRADAPRFA